MLGILNRIHTWLKQKRSSVDLASCSSVAGHIVQKKRSALHSEHVNKLVCNWLKDE